MFEVDTTESSSPSTSINFYVSLSKTYLLQRNGQVKEGKVRKKGLDYFLRLDARRKLHDSFRRRRELTKEPGPIDESRPKLAENDESCNSENSTPPVVTSAVVNDNSVFTDDEGQAPGPLNVDQRSLEFSALEPNGIAMETDEETNVEQFVQDCSCSDLPSRLSRCLECLQAEKDNESAYCRFRDFRRLTTSDHGELIMSGFVNHIYDDSRAGGDAADIREWLPQDNSTDDNLVDTETAKFILMHIAGFFRQLLEKEKTLLNCEILKQGNIDSRISSIPWKDSTGVRELCDVCSTTIFNLHAMCPHCGLCVCMDCFSDRLQERTRVGMVMTQDKYGWIYCTLNGEEPFRKHHAPSDMILAHLIPPCDGNILSTLEELDQQMAVILPDIISSMISYPLPLNNEEASCRMHDGRVLVLRQCRADENLRLFQEHWKSSYPLIVENVHDELSSMLWCPTVFSKLCEDTGSSNCIVDCRSGKIQRSIKVQQFWDGFVDCGKRLRDKDKRKMYLKLKDWPPGDKFASVLRGHYDDFCKALPIPEYTHPEQGRFNLATRLPSFCLAPDLGPKMYTAYDMIFEDEKGTTNLHLDVSDAVNVLVNVTTPANIKEQYLYNAVLTYLEKQGLDEQDLQRAKRNPSHVGALWTIFEPKDNGLIRQFIRKLSRDRRNETSDPIHDQKIYLNLELRMLLEEEYGVKGFTFVQMLGDAVFIPAGAAHQVQNLLCCIKVAEDFVSPEGVQRCAVIADEFRSLTKDHTNHEDKLQLPNMVTHAVRDSISVLKSMM